MDFHYEQLLQHSNQCKHQINQQTKELPPEVLNWKEHPKKWSVLEVLSHLSKVYELYYPNFDAAISIAKDLASGENQGTKRSIMGKLSIYSMKPKGRKRRFQMKTFDFFEPEVSEQHANETINTFFKNKDDFHDLLRRARLKQLGATKMKTALGERVKFYVAECFEFILAHEDRHLLQIEDILQKQGVNAVNS